MGNTGKNILGSAVMTIMSIYAITHEETKFEL